MRRHPLQLLWITGYKASKAAQRGKAHTRVQIPCHKRHPMAAGTKHNKNNKKKENPEPNIRHQATS